MYMSEEHDALCAIVCIISILSIEAICYLDYVKDKLCLYYVYSDVVDSLSGRFV